MLTGKDLISLGFTPGPDFPKVLLAANNCATPELAIEMAKSMLPPPKEKVVRKPSVLPGSALEFFLGLPQRAFLIPPFLEGRQAEPSNSEIRRAFENNAILLNGFLVTANACIDNQVIEGTRWIWQLIWFPKSEKKKCTMVDDPKPEDAMPWFDCDGNLLT